MNLRSILAGVAASTLLASSALAADMTLVSWGGAYQASQVNAYSKPYQAMHPDINFVWDESSAEAVAKLRAMKEANNLTWDLVDVDASDSFRLCDEGLAMEIDPDELLAAAPDGTPASKDFGAQLVNSCYIPQIVYSTTFGYRADTAEWNGAEPSSICDVFDLEKFPGKRALEKRPINNVEWALLCDGVPYEDVYATLETEEGQARAFAKLDTIKDSIIYWESGAQAPQLLADGEVVMTTAWNGRIFNANVQEGKNFVIVWDGQAVDYDVWAIPSGNPKLDLANKFIEYASRPEVMARQSQYIAYGPTTYDAVELINPDVLKDLPTAPDHLTNAYWRDYQWLRDYTEELDSRFQAWKAS